MGVSKLKKILANLLSFSDMARVFGNQDCFILMYHRILPYDYDSQMPLQPGMWVAEPSFRMHLQYLSSNFKIIPLDKMVQKIIDNENLSSCCAITFDDGWRDNYQYAFPLLKKKRIPATIFLTTNYISTDKWFWPEEVAWCLSMITSERYDVRMLPPELGELILQNDNISCKGTELVDKIIEDIKLLPHVLRETICYACSELRRNKQKASKRLMLNWEEIKEMKQSGLITFGTHTASHCLLDQVPVDQIRHELTDSLAVIEKEVESNNFFAYPNGSFNEKVLTEIKNAGIKAAVTTHRGKVTRHTNILTLPRVALHEDISNTLPLLQWRLLVQ